MGVSRRMVIASALLGSAAGVGGWALLADNRVVPGRSAIDSVLGRCDVSDQPPPPAAAPGTLIRSSFYSSHRARSVGYMIAYPPKVTAGASLPVCLFLHGSGSTYQTPFQSLNFQGLLAGAMAAKVPPFVLVSVDGGTNGYWHPRAGGDDPLGMLLDDLPVVLTQHGLPTQVFGLMGYSMGGFGALLAATEQPKRFAAVAVSSPAIWLTFDDSHAVNPAAFDSAEDWHRWGDLRSRSTDLPKIPLRIDVGASDSFEPAIRTLAEQLPDPSVVHIVKGCHDNDYWRSVAPAQLKLIGEALTPPAPAQPTPKK